MFSVESSFALVKERQRLTPPTDSCESALSHLYKCNVVSRSTSFTLFQDSCLGSAQGEIHWIICELIPDSPCSHRKISPESGTAQLNDKETWPKNLAMKNENT